ncbi:DUF3667 domain-containing protein [Flammeovirga pacifica]|uniref:DUF3667 domain-containing protein n=1 Tax=Flammeovirga pacifica TaxID=915059 RepID=A0A1S1YY47_FLAPC|nr:DUF3667 domain-containing protein [Flammeovirga pacifica]OHX65939.1 hypothetical protein NH26_06000 [Flammeovirga pacifica]
MTSKTNIILEKGECKNCNYPIDDDKRYCPNCGQSRVDYNVSFSILIKEFAEEFINWDSRLLHTILPFLFNPSKLTKEYLKGKRIRYVQPFRIYFISSVIFFFVMNHLIINPDDITISKNNNLTAAVDSIDLALNKSIKAEIDQNKNKQDDIDINFDASDITDSKPKFRKIINAYKNKDDISSEYIRDSLGINSWFESKVIEQGKHVFDDNGKSFVNAALSNLSIAFMLLVPLFALFLKLLYIRKKNTDNLYIQHLILSTHLHAFSLFWFTVMLMLGYFFKGEFITQVNVVIFLYTIVSIYFMLKNFYGQSWLKTIIKAQIAFGFHFFIILILSISELIISYIIF